MSEKTNPKDFYLTSQENEEVFLKKIIPRVSNDYDLSSQQNPTVIMTGGLPGAGKSSLVKSMLKEMNNEKTFIANSDEMRPHHPKFKEAVELYGSEAGSAVHHDATIFSEKLIQYMQEQKTNFIIDGTLKDPKKAEALISNLQDNNYNIKITMIAVNEYESLHGVFNRYADQYDDNPKTARFVNPKFIAIGKEDILKSVDVIATKKIDEFKIVDRNHTLLYSSKINKDISPSQIVKDSTNLKNWSNEKINRLQDNWNKVIIKLKEVNVPSNIIESAKTTQTSLNTEIKDIQKEKLYEKVKAFKESRPEKTKDTQKSKGMER